MHKHEFKALPKGTKSLNKRIIAGVTGFCPNSLQKTAIAPRSSSAYHVEQAPGDNRETDHKPKPARKMDYGFIGTGI